MRSSKSKEENKKKVLQAALQCFSKQGVVSTKIETIATMSGVGERTIYRYFENKENIVLGAADLFWEEVFLKIKLYQKRNSHDKKTGLEQVAEVLDLYSKMFIEESRLFVLAIEAELFLYNNQISYSLDNDNIRSLIMINAPLYCAMKKGIEDGSIRKDINFNAVYKATSSALFGIIQKLAFEYFKQSTDDISPQLELETFSLMVLRFLKNEENNEECS